MLNCIVESWVLAVMTEFRILGQQVIAAICAEINGIMPIVGECAGHALKQEMEVGSGSYRRFN